jgi:iron complex outermembrane recepter protein
VSGAHGKSLALLVGTANQTKDRYAMPVALPVRAFAVALALGAATTYAQTPATVAGASLEDLLAVEVTSVSKKEEALFRAPSAIAVLTGEDIRRSGAATVPDALRLIPGLQVAAIDGSKWAVTARGFNSHYANKLLVLVDGRSIYNAATSGVHWSMQDVPLDEIERIEVIRGPGAALWGANAMNGVINIITKPARLTQGGTVTLSTGSLDRGSMSARYGGRIGEESYFRFYTTYTSLGPTVANDDVPPADAARIGHAGFRVDARLTVRDVLTASGSFSNGTIGQRQQLVTGVLPWNSTTIIRPTYADGVVGVVRWDRTLSTRSNLFVQATFERSSRDETLFDIRENAVNLDLEHRIGAGTHDVVWGLGQRLTSDLLNGSFAFTMNPAARRVTLTNAFVQDSITLIPDVLTATVGSKFEYSTASGANAQPNVRLSYSPERRHNVWSSVSHAVRTPARLEQGMQFNAAVFPTATLPAVVRVSGNPALRPERLTAFEVGYRVQPSRQVQIDTTAFYNRYRDLVELQPYVEIEAVPAPLHLVAGQRYANRDGDDSYGVEALLRVQPTRVWTLEGAVTRFTADIHSDPTSVSSTEAVNAGSPKMHWRTTSRLTLGRRLEADATLFHVGAVASAKAPAYTRLDLRLGWSQGPLGFSVTGQNLLDANHLEFDRIDGRIASRIPRSATARLTWVF